jgi:hypothetical protein
MGVPTIASTSPSTGENSVYKNKTLTVTFSETLLSSTVNASTFILKNLDSNQIVPVDVTLLAGSLSVAVTPIRHLIGSTSYRLTIVGANTAVGTPVKSATSDSLATTLLITFSTGDEIEVVAPQKTEIEKVQEGEITLPENWNITVETSSLEIVATDPVNRDYGVDPGLTEISVLFSDDLSTSSITDETFVVSIEPYYEEDEPYFAYPDTSDGSMNFKWQEPTDTSDVPLDFSDLTGTLSSSGKVAVWTVDPDRDFPRNTKVRLTLTTGIESVGGIALSGNYEVVFYIKQFPNVVSVDRIKDEFYPYKLAAWTDDMIGKTIYKNTLDALNIMRYVYDFRERNRILSEYVVASTIVDVFKGLRIEEDLLAGQFKKLGDLVVRYDVGMSGSLPPKMKEAMKKVEELKDMLRGRWTKASISTVKGREHPEQKTIWRTRLWHQDLEFALEGYYAGSQVSGNDRNQRATKVPGALDRW